jgi:hypothetical protein
VRCSAAVQCSAVQCSARRSLAFTQEALTTVAGGSGEEFDCDFAGEGFMPAEVDDSHRASAEHPADEVRVVEGDPDRDRPLILGWLRVA